MRKFVLSLAAAGTALAFASPAAAQYYPQPQPYGQPYGYGYNSGYGNHGYGQVQALQVRIDALQNRIRWLDRRDVIRNHSADRLKEESRSIEKRLHRAARYGLNPYEMNDIQGRIGRLEQRVQLASSGWGRHNGGHGYNGSYGYNGGNGYDRDRDGRDDRYENDQDHDRDD